MSDFDGTVEASPIVCNYPHIGLNDLTKRRVTVFCCEPSYVKLAKDIRQTSHYDVSLNENNSD